MAYPIIAGMLLPVVSTEPVIPVGGPVRLLWCGLFAAGFAIIVPGVLQPKACATDSKVNPEVQADSSGSR